MAKRVLEPGEFGLDLLRGRFDDSRNGYLEGHGVDRAVLFVLGSRTASGNDPVDFGVRPGVHEWHAPHAFLQLVLCLVELFEATADRTRVVLTERRQRHFADAADAARGVSDGAGQCRLVMSPVC